MPKMPSPEATPLRGVLEFYSETGTEGGHWAFQDEKFIQKVPATIVFGGQKIFDPNNPERSGKVQEEGVEVLRGGEWFPLPDPVQSDEDYYLSSLFKGEERGDHEADQRLMERYDFTMVYPSERMKTEMDEKFGEGNWHIEEDRTDIAVGSNGERFMYGGTPRADRPYGVSPGQLTRFNVEWHDGTIEQRLSDSVLQSKWDYGGLHILKNGDQLTIFDLVDPLAVVWGGMIKLKQHNLFEQDVHGLYIHADMEGWNREEWAAFFFNGNRAELLPK